MGIGRIRLSHSCYWLMIVSRTGTDFVNSRVGTAGIQPFTDTSTVCCLSVEGSETFGFWTPKSIWERELKQQYDSAWTITVNRRRLVSY